MRNALLTFILLGATIIALGISMYVYPSTMGEGVRTVIAIVGFGLIALLNPKPNNDQLYYERGQLVMKQQEEIQSLYHDLEEMTDKALMLERKLVDVATKEKQA